MTGQDDRDFYARVAAGMREAQSTPRYTGPTVNVATYWRPSKRHQWRLSSTRVNVPEPDPDKPTPVRMELKDDGSEYAHIPYDWELWTPPARTRVLPGLYPILHWLGRKP
jgi:hypothetical protein